MSTHHWWYRLLIYIPFAGFLAIVHTPLSAVVCFSIGLAFLLIFAEG